MSGLVPADRADALSELHAAAFETAWRGEEIRALLSSGAEAIETPGRGFVLLRTAADEAEILTIAVVPSSRRRGTGRALLEAAAARAQAAGARALFLEVAADNLAAIALYGSCGFTECGRRRAYYPRAGGAPADALVLRRALD